MGELEQFQAHIPGYTLLRRLGKGGMGLVFAARQESLHRDVAIKFLTPVTEGVSATRRFEREARLYPRLAHPNVIKVYDLSLTPPGPPWIALELIEGADLLTLLLEQRVKDPLSLCHQLVSGLAYIHDQGILHRDVKPPNILVTRDNRLVITDFGLARDADANATALTGAGTVVGTASYIAPERARGGEPTVRAEIYEVGLVLYEIALGKAIFTGLAPDPMTLARRLQQSPPPLARGQSLVPAAVALAIDECLALDPAARPASARAVLSRIDASSGTIGIRASAESPSPVAGAAQDGAHSPAGLAARQSPTRPTTPAPAPGAAAHIAHPRWPGGAVVPWAFALALTVATFAAGWTLGRSAANPQRAAPPESPATSRTVDAGRTGAVHPPQSPEPPEPGERSQPPESREPPALSASDAAALIERTRRIDRTWLEEALRPIGGPADPTTQEVERRAGEARALLARLGVLDILERALAMVPAALSPADTPASGSEWADLGRLVLLEHALARRYCPWPFARSLVAEVRRRWRSTDDGDLSDPSWTNLVRGSMPDSTGIDDAHFKDGPYTYKFVIRRQHFAQARLIFAIQHPSPSYVIQVDLAGHTLFFPSPGADPASVGIWVACDPRDSETAGPLLDGHVCVLCDHRLTGARCYTGAQIPAQWLHPGANTLRVNQWDIPGTPLAGLEPPGVAFKVVSVR